ncbi:hypothetical protein L198_06153 [Cryptococcus wingfieldii CBS 7118]|uniref:Retrotransposon gag domain-containing protein n=1 Tax=Cryptococcus wingfieldii CBS 7118 TaxID=1295528 RepID=A0A1E3ISE4_9TREE|nr:hypothetical protein L198_06153 [Cryptococcus wingfieldii CBS 7118]ODN90836.1 hypothetical protein L198_06153 [Cryptococcus wingfieldii CBS 7118]
MPPATRSGPSSAPVPSDADTPTSSLTSLADPVETGGPSQAQSQADPSSEVSNLGDAVVPQTLPAEDGTATDQSQVASGSRATDHPTDLPARGTSLAPSETPSSWHSDLQVLSQNQALLTRLLHTMHEQNILRAQSLPTSQTPPPPDNPSSQPSFERRRRLRPADLTKFGGSDTEDVDMWLEKLTAALEHADYPESELLSNLPFLLEGKALDWFTDLGPVRRDYQTWDEWRVVFKNAFRIPDFEGVMRRKCIARRLQPFESFADYFDDKRRLQRWVYPVGTSSKDLITDIVEGIPLVMRALIKASTPPGASLDDFRRIMLDLQPSLRSQFPTPNDKPPRVHNDDQQDRSRTAPSRQSPQTRAAAPPSPCRACGEWHWREFCPLNSPRPFNTPPSDSYGRSQNGFDDHQRHDSQSRTFAGSGSNGISRPSDNGYQDQQDTRPFQSHSPGNV